MQEAGPFIELCEAAQVESGKAVRVDKDGLSLAVFNLEGEFFVTDDACTHGPGSLSEGLICGEVVECDFHNGAFNIRTGAVVTPPCMVALRTYRTVVTEAGVVAISLRTEAAATAPGTSERCETHRTVWLQSEPSN